MHTCIYVENELAELLAEVYGEVEVYIHSLKEGQCEQYLWVYVLYLFVKRSGVWMRYACLCLVPIRRRKGSANGVHIWHTCKYVYPVHVLSMVHMYDVVDIVNNNIVIMCHKDTISDRCIINYVCAIRAWYVIGASLIIKLMRYKIVSDTSNWK